MTATVSARNASRQALAHRLVAEYRDRQRHPTSWRWLSRQAIANQLDERIDNPSRINQGHTNLCGMAAFVRHWAADDPAAYVQFAINLHEKGAARLGRGDVQRNISPSPILRADHPPSTPQADWLVLASIRDNFNEWLPYRSTNAKAISSTDERLAAINFASDVRLGLVTVGYREDRIIERTNFTRSQGIANALEASRFFIEGYRVILLIHTNLMRSEANRSFRPPIVRSNHWVGLMSQITLSVDRRFVYPFRVFEYGRDHWIPVAYTPRERSTGYFTDLGPEPQADLNRITVTNFSDHYYGFIAAKY